MTCMNTVGKDINELIETHIELWHEATKIKDFEGNLIKDMPTEERVDIFMKIRLLNSQRAKTRDSINISLKSGYPDPKINYVGGSK